MSRVVPTAVFFTAIIKLEEFCSSMTREEVQDFIAQCQVAVQFEDSCPSRPLDFRFDQKYLDARVFNLRSTGIISSLPLEIEALVYDTFVHLSNYYE